MTGFFIRQWKRILLIAVLIVLGLVTLFAISPASEYNLGNLLAGNDIAVKIFLHSRLLRFIACILTGAALATSGLIMQAISRNKFMSPSTAGTTDAATLGMLLSLFFFGGSSIFIQGAFAFSFSLMATGIFIFVVSRIKVRDVVYIPLLGIMYGALIAAITTAIAYSIGDTQLLAGIRIGTFARLGSYTTIYFCIITLVFAVLYASKFSIVSMGQDFSKNLGIKYNRVVALGLVLIAITSASVFVTVGAIPFVGLIIPNMAKSYYGENIKRSIFDIMIMGAAFVLACDILSQLVVYPFEISVGITISILGGIIFMIYLIKEIRDGGRSKNGINPTQELKKA